ncbi:MAG TPA: tRNA (adenosine(37)-N6)-threonylcarbamoyltransferase complex ATPase subunit type 1 TsaE [Balneolales bacterium]|nr:tRNA (adenosine(37)-N6)-threonylcarbamoyltransferase complex ATPase subunit type 1 TsaE [Balneolales bacterium]
MNIEMKSMNEISGKEWLSSSVEDTFGIAAEFASLLEQGDIVCLTGDLGAGKTHFVKGVAKALGIDPAIVSSPTFTLIHEYKDSEIPIYHFDFYRLKSETEAMDIGAEEYFYSEGVCFIEWPEKVPGILPEDALWVQFKHISKNERRILIRKKVE